MCEQALHRRKQLRCWNGAKERTPLRQRYKAISAAHYFCWQPSYNPAAPCLLIMHHPPTYPPVSMLAAAMGPGWEGLMTSQAQAAAKPRMASLPASTSRRRVNEGTSHRPGAL